MADEPNSGHLSAGTTLDPLTYGTHTILADWPWRLLAVVIFGMAFVRRERVMTVLTPPSH